MAKELREGLIVSCQALKDEPLYGGDTIAKMAVAAKMGGASGIRANTVCDINKIYRYIKGSLPIIGLIKKEYDDSVIYITPTLKEVKKLIKSKCDVIALDATLRLRPNGEKLEDLITYIRANSNKKIMADIATTEEALNAQKLGFDYISSTLHGYTENTRDIVLPDLGFINDLKRKIQSSIIVAEGGIKLVDELKHIYQLGVSYIVIGGAITRPQLITKNYTNALKELMNS